ncbi:hypothetical protein [Streptomyces sp. NRRL F-4489]|uniref:hypothetical protein n=1 Tax=Streptomyces sp. NRRL F-4489 TaxID=1609095 RepID=UPI000AC838E2|nr:hypothetical protein [Streptomyces sp. NRRL F-4489]
MDGAGIAATATADAATSAKVAKDAAAARQAANQAQATAIHKRQKEQQAAVEAARKKAEDNAKNHYRPQDDPKNDKAELPEEHGIDAIARPATKTPAKPPPSWAKSARSPATRLQLLHSQESSPARHSSAAFPSLQAAPAQSSPAFSTGRTANNSSMPCSASALGLPECA